MNAQLKTRKTTPALYWLSSFLILALALTACAGASTPSPLYNDGERAMESSGGAPAMEPEAQVANAYGDMANTGAAQIERMVIKNASLSIAVDDPQASLSRISAMADEMGGYVVSANTYQTTLESGQKVPQGSITIRIPAEKLLEALDRIKQETKQPVISENITSQDVTSEYTDLSSRLTNLEAAEKQLQAIMNDASKTEDVISVFNQLTQVREQIEVIKGQMKYYEQSAALSAVSVDLIPNAAVQPLTIGGWQPGGIAKEALQALINALKGLATLGIWFVLFALPIMLIIFGPPALIVWGIFRWRKGRKTKAAAPPVKPA